jgi:hypothetical protein
MSRATLGNLVEDFLRLQLGYGDEIVVNHGTDLLYDVDETDNMEKKLTELGLCNNDSNKNDSALLTLFTYRNQRRQLLDCH